MRSIRLGATTIELRPDGLTVSRIDGLPPVPARAHDTEDYRARAAALGYGADIDRMSRDHEVCHSLTAHWLGLGVSPTMLGVATGSFWPLWRVEEASILATQAFARATGVDLLEVASTFSARDS